MPTTLSHKLLAIQHMLKKKTFLPVSSIEFYVHYHLKIASEMVQCGTNILYPGRDLVLPTYLPSFFTFFLLYFLTASMAGHRMNWEVTVYSWQSPHKLHACWLVLSHNLAHFLKVYWAQVLCSPRKFSYTFHCLFRWWKVNIQRNLSLPFCFSVSACYSMVHSRH